MMYLWLSVKDLGLRVSQMGFLRKRWGMKGVPIKDSRIQI